MNNHKAHSHLQTEDLVYEMTKALALPQTESLKRIIASLMGRVTQRFTELAADLDCIVGRGGIAGGARWLLSRFVKEHSAHGVEKIPLVGPLVIAENHPAFIDSMLISAYIPRRDYKVIIGEIPFFKHLSNISKNAIFAPVASDTMGRIHVVREMIRQLKNDGTILIFPCSSIEPDPAWMPYPGAEFDRWSRSLEIVLRHVPDTQVLIVIASGVISPRVMHHPVIWFRRARSDRQRLAFIYQFIRQMIVGNEVFGLTPHVTFGDLISTDAKRTADRAHMLESVTRSAHRTLQLHIANV